jgi:hypothetical protein
MTMSSGTLFDYFKALPSADDLRRWEEEHARMGVTIKELSEKREQLGQLIKVAATIHGGKEASRRGIGNGNVGKVRRGDKGTWMTAILEVVERHPDGVKYEQLRAEMPEPYASRLSRDPNAKSFYGSMSKLDAAGKVVRHRGHLFTADAFERYQSRVASGEIGEVAEHANRGSPMTDELITFLADHPRSTGAEIKDHLCSFEQFKGGLKRNSSAIYNVLRRLRDREEIFRHEDGSYSLPNENEAPNGNAAGASDAGEAATSPNDSQPTLRLIG